MNIEPFRFIEYSLALNPHAALAEEILKVKRSFYATHHAPSAMWGNDDITLVKFVQSVMMEGKILNCFRNIANRFHPFTVDFKNFGSYPDHTIFLHIAGKQNLSSLMKELRKANNLLTIGKHLKPHYIESPTIMIAGKLLPWQYEKGWNEYRFKSFSGRFIADFMQLKKQQPGEKKFQIVKKFEFLSLPASTTQGALFNNEN